MAYNDAVEVFRDTEYPMMKGKVYLDHGGATIYAKSLIDEFSKKMMANLYGNPHSASDPAMLSGHMVDSIRIQTLAFFGADPEHFDLIFTANATAAIKLVGESFRDLAASNPKQPAFWYGYHKDAHTSIVGVRELSNERHHCFASDDEVDDWLDGRVGSTGQLLNSEGLPGLFAYPGQSNMTGRRLPMGWTKKLRESRTPSHQNTYSLLDAAALATTTQIDLSDPDYAPDFMAVSFYKIFGFPDIGALVVRKKSGHILGWRKYFGGGTVNGLTVIHEASVQRKDATLHDSLEDGTLPFHSIIALGCAIEVHRRLYGSMRSISQHTSFLAYRLYHGMKSLTHYNGVPLCVIYDEPDKSTYGDATTQGATIAFNIMRSDGTYIGHSLIERTANSKGIYLRSGGLCNPGGIVSLLQIELWQYKRAWSAGYRCGDPSIEVVNGKSTGLVRASLGAMSTIADVDALLFFLEEEYIDNMRKMLVFAAKVDNLGTDAYGMEIMRSNDSGIGSFAQSTYNSGGHSFSSPGQVNARRMISSPNLRAPMRPREPRIHVQKSFYEHRPTTANSHISQVSQVSQTSQTFRPPPISYYQRPDAARAMLPANNMRLSDSIDQGYYPVKLNVHDPKPQKGRSVLKFWKPRRPLMQASHNDR
ncbi:related to hxB protein [Rhynchosporium secalis]|uniref:Related to hxB protein n=1 Tax=Rhynchosporium secalis TaxID=38038 RepID=A0A1E1MFW7_RHYSE|nr:related to hxB protein [Rhynchosporium secalis]